MAAPFRSARISITMDTNKKEVHPTNILLILLPVIIAVILHFPLALNVFISQTEVDDDGFAKDERLPSFIFVGIVMLRIEMFCVVLSVAECLTTIFAAWKGYNCTNLGCAICIAAVTVAVVLSLVRCYVSWMRARLLMLADNMEKSVNKAADNAEEADNINRFILSCVEWMFSPLQNQRMIRDAFRTFTPDDTVDERGKKSLTVFCHNAALQQANFRPDGVMAYRTTLALLQKL